MAILVGGGKIVAILLGGGKIVAILVEGGKIVVILVGGGKIVAILGRVPPKIGDLGSWPFTRSCLALLHGSLPLCRCCWQPRSRCLSTLSNTRVALTWRHFVASCDNGHEAPPYALCQTMRWIAGFKLVLTGRKAIENRVAFSRAIDGRKRRTSMGGHPSTQFSSSLPPQPGDSIFPEKLLPSRRCLHKATESPVL
eukprot:COSAG02_NODE_1343_length_13161_cov_12.669959_2_plen_196_part_00